VHRDNALAELVTLRNERRDREARAAFTYQSRFVKWDERASVRRKPRRILEASSGLLFFPPELFPVASHPLVASRDETVVRRLLVHRMLNYLDFTSELEELAVIPIAGRISRGRAGLDLPEPMRADAFKIVTDEAWHAQFSYDLVRQVEHRTGVQNLRTNVPTFASRLDMIRDRLPVGLRGTEGLLFAVVSETLISSILADIPRDERLPRAVRDLVRDHAEDEGRHHVYFRALLRRFWPALSDQEQRTLGPFLPEIILAFLEPDYLHTAQSLIEVGFSPGETEQIVHESWPESLVGTTAAGAARAAVRYFREVGALDELATAQAFCAAGLVPAAEI